jgi:hypothetical protein
LLHGLSRYYNLNSQLFHSFIADLPKEPRRPAVAIGPDIDDANGKLHPVARLYCVAQSFFLVFRQLVLVRSLDWRGSLPRPRATGHAGKGGNVELKRRLNVLAAIMSFGFLAAIVFGMI